MEGSSAKEAAPADASKKATAAESGHKTADADKKTVESAGRKTGVKLHRDFIHYLRDEAVDLVEMPPQDLISHANPELKDRILKVRAAAVAAMKACAREEEALLKLVLKGAEVPFDEKELQIDQDE